MTCDHVTIYGCFWLVKSGSNSLEKIAVADWLAQGEVANHSKDTIDSYWSIN